MNLVLPNPMNSGEEKLCFDKIINGDETGRQMLAERNLRLVTLIIKRFYTTGIDEDELFSIGSIGLMRATKTFKLEKDIRFSTYASRCITNAILLELRKRKGRECLSLDETLSMDEKGNSLTLSDMLGFNDSTVDDNDERRTLYIALQKLTEKQRDFITARYGLKNGDYKSQRDMAKAMGLSQSYASRIEDKALRKLKEAIERMDEPESERNAYGQAY